MSDKHQKRRDALGLFYESVLKPRFRTEAMCTQPRMFSRVDGMEIRHSGIS